jgi:nucleoside-diphosphate-sugar epimerase
MVAGPKGVKLKHESVSSINPISVYGSTGFIGSNFIQKSSLETIPIPKFQTAPASRDILYFIGVIHNYNIFEDIRLDIETNMQVLVETLEAARNEFPNFTFNYISSWAVYGPGKIPFNEDQPCNPRGFYSITKYAAELLLRSFCETYSMDYRIIRLGNVMGQGDKKVSAKKNAVQYMANKIRKGEDVELYEGGAVIRDFLHVDDAVRGIDLILKTGAVNEVYNLASGKGIEVGDLLENFRQLVGSKSRLIRIETPHFHRVVQAKDSVLDISKISSLGFTVLKPFTEKELM